MRGFILVALAVACLSGCMPWSFGSSFTPQATPTPTDFAQKKSFGFTIHNSWPLTPVMMTEPGPCQAFALPDPPNVYPRQTLTLPRVKSCTASLVVVSEPRQVDTCIVKIPITSLPYLFYKGEDAVCRFKDGTFIYQLKRKYRPGG